MPPSRRQPPRSTPPVRRPRVAGLRKPGATDGASSTPSPAPRPAPRPQPAVVEPEPEVVSKAPVAEPEVAEEAVEAPEVAEVPSEPSSASDAAVESVESSEAVTKPSPRAKVRDAGQAKSDDLEEAEAAAAESGQTAEPKSSRVSVPLVLTAGLVVVGLVLAGLAVFFKIQADEVSSSTNNTALLDVAKTSQVKDQVSKATEALFSYDYNNIGKTESAAADLLVNDEVRGKYNLLMGEVKRLAPQQKMVVTCKVTRSAVIRLEGDRADVMVFVDQSSTRADTNKTTAGSAQLHLNAELQGDKWKITAMNTYSAPGAPAQPSAPASPAPSK